MHSINAFVSKGHLTFPERFPAFYHCQMELLWKQVDHVSSNDFVFTKSLHGIANQLMRLVSMVTFVFMAQMFNTALDFSAKQDCR